MPVTIPNEVTDDHAIPDDKEVRIFPDKPDELVESYNELLTKVQKSEVYVSNVLSDMLRDNKSIAFNPLNAKCETIVLGSPQEYGIEFVKKNYEVR